MEVTRRGFLSYLVGAVVAVKALSPAAREQEVNRASVIDMQDAYDRMVDREYRMFTVALSNGGLIYEYLPVREFDYADI